MIPYKYEECTPEDKKLLDMRDHKPQATWLEIRHELERMTGKQLGTSNLPKRYE